MPHYILCLEIGIGLILFLLDFFLGLVDGGFFLGWRGGGMGGEYGVVVWVGGLVGWWVGLGMWGGWKRRG